MRLIDADAMMERLKCWDTNDPIDKALYNFALNRVIEQPTVEPQWIPCSERLPEEYREYLVCYTSDDAVGLLWLDDTRESKAIVKRYNILAWMPLPEPYKGEE